MALDYLKDFSWTRLSGGVTNADLVWPVNDTSRLPSNALLDAYDFYMTVESTFALGAFEIVRIAAKTSNTITVVRAQQGTAAVAHSNGDYLKASLSVDLFKRQRARFTGMGYPPVDAAIFVFGDQYQDLSTNAVYAVTEVTDTDLFDGSDETILRHPWVPMVQGGSAPVFEVVDNRAQLASMAGAETTAWIKTDVGTSDYDLTVVIAPDSTSSVMRLVLRSAAETHSVEYWLVLTAGVTSLGVTLATHGTSDYTNATQVHTFTSATVASGWETAKVRVVCTGASIQVFVNDVSLGSYSAAAITSGTWVGWRTTNTADAIESFQVAGKSKWVRWSETDRASYNTVGPGLPLLVGRKVGDHHFDSTTSVDHVFTGALGNSGSDEFTGTSLEPVGGLAYSAVDITVSGGRATLTSTDSYFTVPVGSLDMTVSAVLDGGFAGVAVRVANSYAGNNYSGYSGYTAWLRPSDGFMHFTRNGSTIATALTVTPGAHEVTVEVTGGVVEFSVDGVVVRTYIDSSPLTGTSAGVHTWGSDSGNYGRVERWSFYSPGTAAWTPISPSLHYKSSTHAATPGNYLVELGALPYEDSLQIFMDGVLATNWTRSGTTVTFTTPLSGTVVVAYQTVTASAPDAVLSGQLAFWSENGSSIANYNVISGNWDSTGGVIRSTNSASAVMRLVRKTANSEMPVVYQAKIRLPSVGQTTGDIYAGLLISDAVGSSGGTLFRIQRVSGNWSVLWEVQGQSVVTSGAVPAVSLDTWYDIKMERRDGNKITASWNGVEFLEQTYGSTAVTYYGLYTYGCLADFDDILLLPA